MSVALELYEALCAIGQALVQVRDTFVLASNEWAALTCIILSLDAAIETLVRSEGLACDAQEDA